MEQPTIAVILGSTREQRFGEKPARWIHAYLEARGDVRAHLHDLRDYPLPFFADAIPPSRRTEPHPNEVVRRWTAAIAAADAFVIVTPEYNHAPPAVLKNALDWVGREWHRKPVTFVAYGNASGARAVEQLRTIAIELQLAPIRSAIHIPISVLMAHFQSADVTPGLAELEPQAKATVEDLLWWTRALAKERGVHSPSGA